MEPLDQDERVYFAGLNAAFDFGEACARFRDGNIYPQIIPLDVAINTLMTELWDHGFSQTEIRTAFEAALQDMNRYAAGRERR